MTPRPFAAAEGRRGGRGRAAAGRGGGPAAGERGLRRWGSVAPRRPPRRGSEAGPGARRRLQGRGVGPGRGPGPLPTCPAPGAPRARCAAPPPPGCAGALRGSVLVRRALLLSLLGPESWAAGPARSGGGGGGFSERRALRQRARALPLLRGAAPRPAPADGAAGEAGGVREPAAEVPAGQAPGAPGRASSAGCAPQRGGDA